MRHVKVSSPGGLAGAVTGLLGFEPKSSIVLVCLGENGILGAVARLDIPEPVEMDEATESLLGGLSRAGTARRLLLLGFEDTQGESSGVLEAVAGGGASRFGFEVVRSLVVRSGRVREFGCSCSACHAGERIETVAGLRQVLDSREQIVDLFEPVGVDAADVQACLCTTAASLRAVLGAWARVCAPAGTLVADLPPEVVAVAVRGVQRADVRDVVIGWMTEPAPGAAFDESARALVELVPFPCPSGSRYEHADVVGARLVELVRRVPTGLAPQVLAVVAHWWWCSGDGIRASAAADRALSLQPDHRLAAMISQALRLGIRPPSMPR